MLGPGLSLPHFIRTLVGLDRGAAKAAFDVFLQGGRLRGDQIRFIETLLDYLTHKGVMDPGLLYEPPFTDLHAEGLDGVFADIEAGKILAIVRGLNEGVGVRFG